MNNNTINNSFWLTQTLKDHDIPVAVIVLTIIWSVGWIGFFIYERWF